MTNDERDKKITETHILTKQTHAVLFGTESKKGMKEKFDGVAGIVYFMIIAFPIVGVITTIYLATRGTP